MLKKHKLNQTWNETPMPIKTMLLLWDGKMLWGPIAPQTDKQRADLQHHYKPTHWMEIPPAPVHNK